MTHEVLFEPTASRELSAAADFYDLEQPNLGTEFLDAGETALVAVVDNPRAFPVLLGETRKRVVNRFPYLSGGSNTPVQQDSLSAAADALER